MPAKFDHQGDDWTDHAWSLVVESDSKPDVRGLMPNAPADWPVQGKKFTLQEGSKRLAEGELV